MNSSATTKTEALLFRPLRLREVELANRVVVAPMCQYSAKDGLPNNWHLVHLGSRAIGGAGLVFTEATAVSPEGRITPGDLGLWSDEHAQALKPITEFISEHGSVPGIQLAHAGRRGARMKPWDGNRQLVQEETWPLAAPAAIAFDEGWQTPEELSHSGLEQIIAQFVSATKRALVAGFKVLELHMAHGYLLHSFLSPLSNHRSDAFGGSVRKRAEFPLRIVDAVRSAWPHDLPLFARLSAVDWVPHGLTIEESVEISKLMKSLGVDLVDCSSGFNVPKEEIPAGYPFQVPFAAKIKREAGIPTGAVGFILDAKQAESILAEEQADLVFLARGMLHDPYWSRHAAATLGQNPLWPKQYARSVRHFHDGGWQPTALGAGQVKSPA